MEGVLPAFLERGYVVLEGALTPAELAMLRAQACCLTQRLAAAGRDLCDEQCVAEVIEHLPEGHAARTKAADYLRLREAELPSTDPALMHGLLMRRLAALASAALNGRGDVEGDGGGEVGGGDGGGDGGDGGGDGGDADAGDRTLGAESPPPCLFNEHFVLKPARRAGPFAWHTDGAHQLEALLALGDAAAAPEYVSVWCALDDITEANGPLVLLPRDAPQPTAPWHEPVCHRGLEP